MNLLAKLNNLQVEIIISIIHPDLNYKFFI